MKKQTIDVAGMHCKSCELLLEKSLGTVKNVKKVRADQHAGTVEISYETEMPDQTSIEGIIRENGYSLGKEGVSPWIHSDPMRYVEVVAIALALYALYVLFQKSGLSIAGFSDISAPSVTTALLVGLAAGVSSCMALVGGLVLAVSAEWNESQSKATKWQRFEPHLYFHLGRVGAFALLGGLLGMLGGFISLSPLSIGVLTIVAGVIMLSLGVKLADLSPRLSRYSITLPKWLGIDTMNSSNSKHLAAISGGVLTFFLPCGFTLAMQAYAITTGSFVAGAMILAAFAIGTAPGLLGVGGLASYFSGGFGKRFFRFTGVLVLLLAIFNISNGYTLMGLGTAKTQVVPSTGPVSDEIQEIRMTEGDSGYTPNVLYIKPNMKTRWIVTAENPYSCASQLVAPAIGVQRQLEAGENIIEFVSPASGTIRFSCSMGMYTGKMIVDAEKAGTSSVDTSSTRATVANGRGYSCPMMSAPQSKN